MLPPEIGDLIKLQELSLGTYCVHLLVHGNICVCESQFLSKPKFSTYLHILSHRRL